VDEAKEATYGDEFGCSKTKGPDGEAGCAEATVGGLPGWCGARPTWTAAAARLCLCCSVLFALWRSIACGSERLVKGGCGGGMAPKKGLGAGPLPCSMGSSAAGTRPPNPELSLASSPANIAGAASRLMWSGAGDDCAWTSARGAADTGVDGA
jgi:hypothetical protein